MASYGPLDLQVRDHRDTEIDDHHTNEDVGIGVGHFLAPLDEALAQVALDCSGHPHLEFDLQLRFERIGRHDTQLVREFFVAVVNNSGLTLHIGQLHGSKPPHCGGLLQGLCPDIAHGYGGGPQRSGQIPAKGVEQAGTPRAPGATAGEWILPEAGGIDSVGWAFSGILAMCWRWGQASRMGHVVAAEKLSDPRQLWPLGPFCV